VVFKFGRGGGQWGFPALNSAVTAGLAQFGIVGFGGFVDDPHGRVGGEGGTQCAIFGAIHLLLSNWDVCCCIGGCMGCSAGGVSCRGAYGMAQSNVGFGDGVKNCCGRQLIDMLWVAGGGVDGCKGIAAGFGAEGVAHGGTYCGVRSSVGAGHSRCGGLLSRFWGDGGQRAGGVGAGKS